VRRLRRISGSLPRLSGSLPRPLDPVRSIKVKLGLLVVASGAAGLAYFWLSIGWLPPVTSAVAIGLSLLITLILAHGMTRPLREMTAAARAMARGDYSTRVRATARDEVGELAAAFNVMAADLEAADRQRRELVANVSHELRTPITALRAVLENIVDGVAEPDPRTLRTLLAQTERLALLVTELLDLSRIDEGAHELRRSVFGVGRFVDDVVAEAMIIANGAGRGITFAASVTPTDARAFGDRERLKLVLLNLLDNAARHSPDDGKVRVSAWVDAGDARGAGQRSTVGQLVMEIGDDGPGIDPEERELVFERFTRGERARGGGTGLGLAIARWVVTLHGGAIAVVDQSPGGEPVGCLIRVTIPAGVEGAPTL
jgi:signal transduction histidine kinase